MKIGNIIASLSGYPRLLKAVGEGGGAAVSGCTQAFRAALLARLSEDTGRPLIVICPEEGEASRFADDLSVFIGEGVFVLPVRDIALSGAAVGSRDYEYRVMETLSAACSGRAKAVVTTPEAASRLTLPPDVLRSRTISLKQGGKLDPQELLVRLAASGYSPAAQVDGKGQFCRRGGIIDVFPANTEQPLRLDFWGDEIDSLAYFDVDSQRSSKKIKKAEIMPAAEIFPDDRAEFAEALGRVVNSNRSANAAAYAAHAGRDLEAAAAGGRINYDRYINVIHPGAATVFDYFSDPICAADEYSRVAEAEKGFMKRYAGELENALREGYTAKGADTFYISESELTARIKSGMCFESFVQTALSGVASELIPFDCRQNPVWGGMPDDLIETLKDSAGFTSAVLAPSSRGAKAIASDLTDAGIPAVCGDSEIVCDGLVHIVTGGLSGGFELPEKKFSVISGGAARHTEGARRRTANAYDSISELKVGSYVVHNVHGIGIYEGTFTMTAGGATKDYLKISYAGGDSLYLPVTQLDMLAKYIGPEDGEGKVRLNRLGGGEWQRTKSRVKAAVRDMANELIALYARRESQPGRAFGPDTPWQDEFEQRFEYDETDDQLRCAAEIKEDMEKPRPMDRLLCGDVGFGKTEVALRAVFKCVMDGCQAAIVAPTTILAWQHYETVCRRMSGFGLKIGLLSRFVQAGPMRDTLTKTAAGEIDIVIGTHRVLQKDVSFRRLGLLVIDEEQRFGVADKEKLKQKYSGVDVLTLSATPIPRTMNMALTGLRDMSMIDESPLDRHPVQTYVSEFDLPMLADAVRRELRRGGQVYWLHNRIDDIARTAAKLADLLPGARVAYAHGQMEKKELSEIWQRMAEGGIDVLVCTTIIEAGVDLGNVNTLVIEDADRMGLSQLHQIRGRVGRSSRRAYAYLTFKPMKALSEVASKRLEAIKEFTEFGAGYAIAVRDMEIRGAGNLLGAQQHGHMAAVGYDMYLKLMAEAVAEARGEKRTEAPEPCLVDLPVDAYIPESYIASSGQRLEIYRKIAAAGNKNAGEQVRAELLDRFGEPPREVAMLLAVAGIRNRATAAGITELSKRGDGLVFYLPNQSARANVRRLVEAYRGRTMANPTASRPNIYLRLDGDDPLELAEKALEVLSS